MSKDKSITTLTVAPKASAKENRKAVIAILQAQLADSFDLYSQIKQAHWNVKGAEFIALHELFDTVAGTVLLATDTLAERILQLGGEAAGTTRFVAKKSTLPEYPHLTADCKQHVKAVSTVLELYTNASREAINSTDDLGDPVTADILTGITRDIDKHLWFVSSHL
jgi:starvation-inducible DNA-binding protein